MNLEALFLGVFGGTPYTYDDALDWDYYYYDLYPGEDRPFSKIYLYTVEALT